MEGGRQGGGGGGGGNGGGDWRWWRGRCGSSSLGLDNKEPMQIFFPFETQIEISLPER